MPGRKRRTLSLALAALTGLALCGCWLPRLLMAAFMPFQSLLVWVATIACRYGAPLIMLMFVDGSDMTLPKDKYGLPQEPFVCLEEAPVEAGRMEGVRSVVFADFSRLTEREWLIIQQEAAGKSQRLVLAPAGEWPAKSEVLEEAGIAVKFMGAAKSPNGKNSIQGETL